MSMTHGEDGAVPHPGSKPRVYGGRGIRGHWRDCFLGCGGDQDLEKDISGIWRGIFIHAASLEPAMSQCTGTWSAYRALQLRKPWGLPPHSMSSGSQKSYMGHLCERR